MKGLIRFVEGGHEKPSKIQIQSITKKIKAGEKS